MDNMYSLAAPCAGGKEHPMTLTVHTASGTYDVVAEPGAAGSPEKHLALDRRVLIVTDRGVPKAYAVRIAAACRESIVVTVSAGEKSKSIRRWKELHETMLHAGFTRSDCVVAVGGGVVGDLAGFAAATYMRGIDFYNIPTTLLAAVDASVGGKTSIDLGGVKNPVGAFWPPKKVIVDAELLNTLPPREIAAGMAESIKMAATLDTDFFAALEGGTVPLADVIGRSVLLKRRVVEEDERESGLRRVLNFGHTLGHGIEARGGRLHGECVALGMIPMCEGEVRERLVRVLEKYGLPTSCRVKADAVMHAVLHDKKMNEDGTVTVVTVPEIGKFAFVDMTPDELRVRLAVINR